MDQMGFSHFAQCEPDTTALVDPTGRRWQRGELFALSNRLSRALRAAGLTPGDSIAILAPNGAEYLVTYLAATQIGLYVVPINWHLTQSEIAYILSDSNPRALVVHERLAGLARAACAELPEAPWITLSMGPVSGATRIEEFVAPFSCAALADPVLGRPMFYTSATTGRPKAISLPLPGSLASLEKTIRLHIAVGIGLGSAHVHLCASVLYHAAPLEGCVIALHMGHCVLLVERAEPLRLLQLIAEHGVTTSFMVPTTFVRLLKLPEEQRRQHPITTLKRVVHSGAPCPPEVKRQMIEWWGPILWDTYGAVEGAGTIVSSEEWLRYPGTVGRPIPGTDLRILDDEDREVPRGEVGQIYFSRYTGDTFEYRGDEARTRACHRGHLFTVGDIGYVNDEGYLFICDRKIDMIISGGMNIYSAEVERLLILHPAIADCAVFGVPDTLLGEAVRAVVQPVTGIEGSSTLTRDILQFLGKQLSATKLPKRIEYLQELPRDPNGKLYKRRLREPHWQGLQRNI